MRNALRFHTLSTWDSVRFYESFYDSVCAVELVVRINPRTMLVAASLISFRSRPYTTTNCLFDRRGDNDAGGSFSAVETSA